MGTFFLVILEVNECVCVCVCVCFIAFGDSDPSMREDREDRDAYRRGGPECESVGCCVGF